MTWCRRSLAVLVCGLALLPGGCALFPRAVDKTYGHPDQPDHLADEEQLLRSLVRVRYNEAPRNGVPAAAAESPTAETDDPSPSDPEGGTDVRQFLTPITADTFVFLAQTHRPLSAVLRLWVERLNGVPNGEPAEGDAGRFLRVVQLLQAAQDRDLLSVHTEDRLSLVGSALPPEAVTAVAQVEAACHGLEYRRAEDGKGWVLMRKDSRLVLAVSPGAETSPLLAELAGLLNLRPGLPRYELLVVAGGVPDPQRRPTPPAAAVRLVPRSTSQVYAFLANGVEVPAEHLDAGLVKPAPVDRELTRGLFAVRVAAGSHPPPDAYVAVRYRGHWFYIDDRDRQSKATLALMLQLGRLDVHRPRPTAPPPTLTAGR